MDAVGLGLSTPASSMSDGKFPVPFVTGHSSLAGFQPSMIQDFALHSTHVHERQMPQAWTPTTSAESSNWSHSSGNSSISSSQFKHLLAQFNELQREHRLLLTKNAALEAKVETFMMAYNMLLNRIPASPTNRPALCQKDYPNVRFWTRHDWNAATQDQVLEVDLDEEGEMFPEPDEDEDAPKEPSLGPACMRGKHRSSQGINVTMKYIELEDGTVVDGFRAAEIRRYARSIWVQMALDGKLPRTWTDVDAASLATYNESMAQHFVELRLCAADWKANLVATDNYPSWRHNWTKKKTKEVNSTSKRSIGSHSEGNVKKLKISSQSGDDSIPEQVASSFDTLAIPVPKINIIPGTPLRPQLAAMPLSIPPSEELHALVAQPTPYHNLDFTVENPLASNSNQPLTNFATFGKPEAPTPYQYPVPSLDVLTSAATHTPSNAQLPLNPTKNDTKRSKGTRMRPTKTTTARNLCALEWVKNNSQGTTEEFKIYYNNLSEEQKKVWENKSKAL
ncbi:hypothetical protein BDN70DRAFT_937577 [Pholiota conissans]|uniref:Uncharacterized protein n=1 Tax=Pholiota conissans TaxID=109636 RepID=A0A9P6CV54_9AGAR|nr:hypothetical protein BDN70DRAFT_937577 [Pholiota conissans]